MDRPSSLVSRLGQTFWTLVNCVTSAVNYLRPAILNTGHDDTNKRQDVSNCKDGESTNDKESNPTETENEEREGCREGHQRISWEKACKSSVPWVQSKNKLEFDTNRTSDECTVQHTNDAKMDKNIEDLQEQFILKAAETEILCEDHSREILQIKIETNGENLIFHDAKEIGVNIEIKAIEKKHDDFCCVIERCGSITESSDVKLMKNEDKEQNEKECKVAYLEQELHAGEPKETETEIEAGEDIMDGVNSGMHDKQPTERNGQIGIQEEGNKKQVSHFRDPGIKPVENKWEPKQEMQELNETSKMHGLVIHKKLLESVSEKCREGKMLDAFVEMEDDTQGIRLILGEVSWHQEITDMTSTTTSLETATIGEIEGAEEDREDGTETQEESREDGETQQGKTGNTKDMMFLQETEPENIFIQSKDLSNLESNQLNECDKSVTKESENIEQIPLKKIPQIKQWERMDDLPIEFSIDEGIIELAEIHDKVNIEILGPESPQTEHCFNEDAVCNEKMECICSEEYSSTQQNVAIFDQLINKSYQTLMEYEAEKTEIHNEHRKQSEIDAQFAVGESGLNANVDNIKTKQEHTIEKEEIKDYLEERKEGMENHEEKDVEGTFVTHSVRKEASDLLGEQTHVAGASRGVLKQGANKVSQNVAVDKELKETTKDSSCEAHKFVFTGDQTSEEKNEGMTEVNEYRNENKAEKHDEHNLNAKFQAEEEQKIQQVDQIIVEYDEDSKHRQNKEALVNVEEFFSEIVTILGVTETMKTDFDQRKVQTSVKDEKMNKDLEECNQGDLENLELLKTPDVENTAKENLVKENYKRYMDPVLIEDIYIKRRNENVITTEQGSIETEEIIDYSGEREEGTENHEEKAAVGTFVAHGVREKTSELLDEQTHVAEASKEVQEQRVTDVSQKVAVLEEPEETTKDFLCEFIFTGHHTLDEEYDGVIDINEYKNENEAEKDEISQENQYETINIYLNTEEKELAQCGRSEAKQDESSTMCLHFIEEKKCKETEDTQESINVAEYECHVGKVEWSGALVKGSIVEEDREEKFEGDQSLNRDGTISKSETSYNTEDTEGIVSHMEDISVSDKEIRATMQDCVEALGGQNENEDGCCFKTTGIQIDIKDLQTTSTEGEGSSQNELESLCDKNIVAHETQPVAKGIEKNYLDCAEERVDKHHLNAKRLAEEGQLIQQVDQIIVKYDLDIKHGQNTEALINLEESYSEIVTIVGVTEIKVETTETRSDQNELEYGDISYTKKQPRETIEKEDIMETDIDQRTVQTSVKEEKMNKDLDECNDGDWENLELLKTTEGENTAWENLVKEHDKLYMDSALIYMKHSRNESVMTTEEGSSGTGSHMKAEKCEQNLQRKAACETQSTGDIQQGDIHTYKYGMCTTSSTEEKKKEYNVIKIEDIESKENETQITKEIEEQLQKSEEGDDAEKTNKNEEDGRNVLDAAFTGEKILETNFNECKMTNVMTQMEKEEKMSQRDEVKELEVQVITPTLDFSAQKLRIAVKNRNTRLPKDPRALIERASVLPVVAPLPLKIEPNRDFGMVGVKLPALAGGLPVLKRIGREIREREEENKELTGVKPLTSQGAVHSNEGRTTKQGASLKPTGMGAIGVKLPGLGIGIPVLKKINRGTEAREPTEGVSEAVKSDTESALKLTEMSAGFPVLRKTGRGMQIRRGEDKSESEGNTSDTIQKSPWDNHGSPGRDNPVMSELKNKLRKT